MNRRRSARALPALVLALWMTSVTPLPAAEGEATVVYLVRHAEKMTSQGMDQPKGPDLTEAGKERAGLLARMLRAEAIDFVHSSDYTRTLETAKPLAKRLGKEVKLYDPRALKDLAVELLHAGGRHVVVGHSNTTPHLAELLGGDPGEEIDEPAEYDRLYVVIIDSDGAATTLHLRYGDPFGMN